MTIDKAIHRAPLGLPQDDLEGDIEIEIEDPEGVRISMDGLEIELGKADPEEGEFNENLAEVLSEGEMSELVGDLIGDFDDDISSRKDWMQTYVDRLRS